MIDNFAIAIAVSMTLTGLSVAVSGVGVFWGLAERGGFSREGGKVGGGGETHENIKI